MIPFVELHLDPYLIWDKLSSNSRVNDMYILFVILYSYWSGKVMLYSFSIGKVLLFVMRILSCVMIYAVTFICLVASKIF